MAWGSTGAEVALSKDSSATVLFARSGQTTVKQNETVETTEWRGLTESAAKAKCVATAFSSDYAETTWYKTIDNEARNFTAVTGTRTDWSASRADESGQWTATRSVTTYSVSPTPSDAGWSTTAIDAAGSSTDPSSTGSEWQTVSKDVSLSQVYAFNNKPLCSKQTVTVEEKKYLTESAATALVSSSASYSVTPTRKTYSTSAATAWCYVNVGTEVHASASFVSADEGWTVTKTTTLYESYAEANTWQ